jgi:small redox-active disulfide protein 2
MKLQVYGTGCAKCKKLAQATQLAADALGVDYTLEKVTDLTEILAAGVMMTPALSVDGVVKVSGSVPSLDELKALLS